MTERCSVEWDTEDDDEDGDGEAEHRCFLPDGHDDEIHWCSDHFSCNPVVGAPAWFAEDWSDEPGTRPDSA